MTDEQDGAPELFMRRPSRDLEDVAYRQALRLTFSFDGPQVQLILREPVEMTLPPSAQITDEPPGAAFWFEIHDAERSPLYRRTHRHPLDPTVEVRTGDPERPLAHVDSGRTSGTFTLMVPDLAEAQSVVLYGWDVPAERDREPAPVELAHFPIGAAVNDDMLARDTVPPTTVSDAVASYRGTAVIHLRAFDNMGDVARTLYRLDDGDEQEGLTVIVGEPGRHRLAFWSVDRAGNVEAENVITFTVGRPAGVE
jgi:hypothetical protein